MGEPRLNLRILKRSRGLISSGDIFAMQLADGHYLFGRVIAAALPRQRAPMPGSNLVYVYRNKSSRKAPDLESLTPGGLLIAPVFTNRLGWTKGYFENVASLPVTNSDLLSRHCFRTWNGRFVDIDGSPLSQPSEPCGDWALTSYRMIDDMISDALHIPRAPVA